jgi:hypothetical protein
MTRRLAAVSQVTAAAYAKASSTARERQSEGRTTGNRQTGRRLTLYAADARYREAIVDQRKVVILSSRGLFREGLKHLLAREVTPVAVTSAAEVDDLLRREAVDIVILDEEEDLVSNSDFVCRLLATPGRRVISVSLAVNEIHIYQHQRVANASPEALIAAISQ